MPILNHNDLKKVEEYQNFVRTSPFANATQDLGWEKVKEGWIGEQVYLEEDGKIIAAMSLIIRRAFAGFSLMYAPRAPICDFSDTQLVKRLLDEAKPLAKKYHAFVLRFDPELPRLPQLEEEYRKMGLKVRNDGCDKYDLIQPRYNMILNLDEPSFDELMPHFSEKTRYNIRVAVKKGVEVRVCGKEMVPDFARIMLETGVRDGFVTRQPEYFSNMLDNLGEHARLYMAFYEGAPIAGTLAIWYGDKVWYLYGASSNEHRNLMPNYLLQWSMIQWAIEKGCRIYDFRGVSGDLSEDNPLYGLYKFKKGFNGEFTEFVGELDLVLNRPVYFAVEHGTSLFKELRKRVFLRKNRDKRPQSAPQEQSPVQDKKPATAPGNKTDADGAQAPGQSREHGAPQQ